jgi:hypothetical protein
MIEVELTKSEVFTAAMVGLQRQCSSLFKKSKNRFEIEKEKEWGIHIIGAMGEAAAARGLGMYWPMSVDTYKDPDILPNIQVRTRTKDDGDLIVRDDDDDNEIFVLVTGTGPKFMLRGYVTGKEAKKKEWLKSPNGWKAAYFVPQSKLKSIEDLLKENK